MKSLLVLHNLPTPYRLPLFEELSKHYNTTVWFYQKNDSSRKWSWSLDNASYRYRFLSWFRFSVFIINPGLVIHLLQNQYDVYLINDNDENCLSVLATLIFARITGKRAILWNERTIEPEVFQTILPQTYKEQLLRRMYHITRSICFGLADTITSFSGLYSDLYLTTHYNIKYDKIASTTQTDPTLMTSRRLKVRTHNEDTTVRFLYLGYFSKRKGIEQLLESFSTLTSSVDTPCELVFAGAGELEDTIDNAARRNSKIKNKGYVEGARKADIYKNADVFVLPTLYDVWGLVINEALYYNLPVITTSAAGGSQLIRDGVTGWVIPPGDTGALTEVMHQALSGNTRSYMKQEVAKIPTELLASAKRGIAHFREAIEGR